jgi:hypothetical protein
MTQPVTSGRASWPADFDGPPPPPELPVERLSRDLRALPDPGDGAPGQGLVRLTPLPSAGIDPPSSGVTAVGARLDAFLARATPTFRTPEGSVAVPIGFWINAPSWGPPPAALDPVLSAVGLSIDEARSVKVGRGSPEVIQRVVQRLIDAGQLPAQTQNSQPSKDLGDRVRQLMFTWHLGLDCAGYVAPATIAAQGVSRAAASLGPADDEALANLAGRGYAIVGGGPANWRAGDLVVLAPNKKGEYGHTAIVRAAAPASPEEIQRLRDRWSLPPAAAASAAWDKVVVDSSWGNSGQPELGGVERRTWWHDQTTGLWASASSGDLVVTKGPYDHDHHQVFRPKETR